MSEAAAADGAETETEKTQEAEEVEAVPVEPPPLPEAAKDAAPEPMSVVENLPPRSWPPRVVADLMTRQIIAMEQDEPVGELEAWMQRFRFRHLPVVDAQRKLVGLITRTDFLHAALGVAPDGKAIPKVDASTPAGAIMRRNVVVAKLDSPLATACEVMLREKLSCLPVVLEDGTAVGILTEADFTRLTYDLLTRRASPEDAPPSR